MQKHSLTGGTNRPVPMPGRAKGTQCMHVCCLRAYLPPTHRQNNTAARATPQPRACCSTTAAAAARPPAPPLSCWPSCYDWPEHTPIAPSTRAGTHQHLAPSPREETHCVTHIYMAIATTEPTAPLDAARCCHMPAPALDADTMSPHQPPLLQERQETLQEDADGSPAPPTRPHRCFPVACCCQGCTAAHANC